MDFTALATAIGLFSALAYGVVDRVKAAVPSLTTMQVVLISTVVCLGSPFVVAYSTFGNDVVLGTRHLNDVNGMGLLVLGLLAAFGSSVFHQAIGSGGSSGSGGAVSNIGQNQGS